MKNLQVNKALAFTKMSIVELNGLELKTTDSGSTPFCVAAIGSSAGCAIIAGEIALGFYAALRTR